MCVCVMIMIVIIVNSQPPDPTNPSFHLASRCLVPGMYAKHLERWLDHFSASQLTLIDGEELRSDPVFVMNDLQRFLGIQPFYNYTEHLRLVNDGDGKK